MFFDTPMVLFGIELDRASESVIGIVAFLAVCFVLFYVMPAVWSAFRIRATVRRLSRLKDSGRSDVSASTPPKGPIRRAWDEYAETLHEQKAIVDGEERVIQTRATVPAEMYFTKQALIDTPLHVEFFKHLPGVLTGVGIIGTFWHIITGLQGFHPSMEPEVLNQGLTVLITSVYKAFIASLAAITVAMIITFLEKLLLNWCYGLVEKLCHGVDRLFEAGAGEEYLARLVTSAEESATQTRHLKDSLVEDLKQLLTGLAERQMQAAATERQALVEDLSGVLNRSLAEPMSKISAVVEQSSGDQGRAVQGMVSDLLSAFMTKLDETVGGQMSGLATMMSQNVEVMREMQENVRQMVADLSATSAASTRDLNEQIIYTLKAAEDRQRLINESVQAAVEQMRSQLSSSQGEMASRLEETLSGISATMRGLMDELAEGRKRLADESAREQDAFRETATRLLQQIQQTTEETQTRSSRQMEETIAGIAGGVRGMMEEMAENRRLLAEEAVREQTGFRETAAELLQSVERSAEAARVRAGEELGAALDAVQERFGQQLDQIDEKVIGQLSSKLDTLVGNIDKSIERMTGTVQQVDAAAARTIQGLGTGAETMRLAAMSFTSGAGELTTTLARTRELFEQVSATARSLENSSGSIRDAAATYEASRRGIETMLSTLKQLMQDAEERVGVSQNLIRDMERLARQFEEVQARSGDYLTRVTEVLERGFGEFAEAVTVNMGRARGEFDKSLSTAVEMLGSQLQELEALFDQINARGRVNA